jgi:general secretion pathway protein A
MYLSFFGFSEKPFHVTPNPRFLFLSKTHKEALAHLLYGLRDRCGFIQLTGEVGTGKTTVLRSLLSQLDGDIYRSAFIFNPCLAAPELLRAIQRELGLGPSSGGLNELLDDLNAFLLHENAVGRTVLLVIDEAQNLAPEVLEQIRLLSNLETATAKLIQIVLAGQPELSQVLGQRGLRQLNQRINIRYQLHPLDFEDTRAYMEHRLFLAGGEPATTIFTLSAVRLVFRLSGGMPRLINALCDRALLVAYAAHSHQVVTPMVDEAAVEMGRQIGTARRLFTRLWPY